MVKTPPVPTQLDSAVIFPLWAMKPDGSACTCAAPSCAAIGKHPNRFRPAQEGAGYGVETGEVSSIFVLDVDTKKDKEGFDGWDSLQKFAEKHGKEAFDTFTVKTGSGGLHFYYRHPGGELGVRNSVSKLSHGLDIRGEGGFVVGPGSPHVSGTRYTVVNDAPIAPAPAWLLEWPGLYRAPRQTADDEGGGDRFAAEPIPDGSAECAERTAQFAADLETADPSVQGQNGSLALFRACIRGVRYYELSDDIVLDLLEKIYNPRCIPAWSFEELAHKVRSARFDSSIPVGCPPANWSETLDRLRARARTPILLQRAPGSVAFDDLAKPERQIPNGNHEYSYEVGVDTAANERKKYPLAFLVNVLLTHDAWAGVLQYNKFAEHLHAVNPPLPLDAETSGLSIEDVNAVRCWFETNGVAVGFDDVKAAIKLAARANSYNPVTDYLDSLATDSAPDRSILDNLAARWFGAKLEIESVFLKRWLVAAVRRAYDPGCKVDTTLVLKGAQGIGKSDFVTALFGEWYRDQMPDLNSSRDASHALEGFWAVEFGELDKLLRVDARTVKDFLTRRIDNYRAFGTGEKIARKRSAIFIGTTNEDDFLRDSTGERRFLPIEVTQEIPGATLRAERDAVWRAARWLALEGYVFGADVQPAGVFPHWFRRDEDLTPEMQATRARYTLGDPWEDDIAEYLTGRESVLLRDVYLDVVAKHANDALAKFDRRIQLRLGNVLRALGCTRGLSRAGAGEVTRAWLVPDARRDAPAKPAVRTALQRIK